MNKKEIITLIAVGVVVFFISCFGALLLVSPNNHNEGDNPGDIPTTSKPTPTSDDAIKVGKYALHYGNYYCKYEEYEDGKLTMHESALKLDKDEITIGDEEYDYVIEGDKLKLEDGPELRAIDNNRIRMEAGAGLEYSYMEAK